MELPERLFGLYQGADYGLTPYFLGMILWGTFFVYENLAQQRTRQTGDRCLLISIAFCFLTELFLFTINAMLVEDLIPDSALLPFWPPLQAMLLALSRIFLATAFLRLLLHSRLIPKGFLAFSVLLLLAAYLYTASRWLTRSVHNTSLQFSDTPESLLIGGSAVLMMVVAITLIMMHSSRRNRLPIASGFFLILLDVLVAFLTLDAPSVFTPIHGILASLAVPMLAYASFSLRLLTQKQLDAGIQNSERLEALGQLSSGIAHDFNNHLQVILGYVELAKNQQKNGVSMNTALNRIEEAAEAAGSLVNQLLTFSRGQKTEFSVIDLNETIMSVTPMVTRLLGPDIRIATDLDLNTPPVYADRRMIEQVVFNLMINARDAMANSGVIHLSTSVLEPLQGATSDMHTRLTIGDTGCGMDKKTLRHAFEPFYTTKPVGEGTGLGLATVYGIVQKHHARISIDTEPGQYTRVHIDFPMPATPVVKKPGITTPQRAKDGETILLVEDEIAIRDLAKTFLTSFGYHVLVANDGQHAINIANTYLDRIDLCLFDVIMPRMNGYQAYDKIIAQGKYIPALFITGSTSRAEELRQQHPHLQKPFTSESLLYSIRDVLDQKVDN